MSERDILEAVPFFREALDDQELTILAGHARHAYAREEGENLISEDRPGHSMFVIVDGDVEVTTSGARTPSPASARARSSASVAAHRKPRNATVTADKVEVVEVDKAALANVLWMSPSLVDRFVEMLFRRQWRTRPRDGRRRLGYAPSRQGRARPHDPTFYERAE